MLSKMEIFTFTKKIHIFVRCSQKAPQLSFKNFHFKITRFTRL